MLFSSNIYNIRFIFSPSYLQITRPQVEELELVSQHELPEFNGNFKGQAFLSFLLAVLEDEHVEVLEVRVILVLGT